jgi:chemotaxis protein CheC
MESEIGLSEAQLDALKEVGNIGAAHASAALEQMLGKRITITVPRTHPLLVEDLEDILKVPGKEDYIIVGLFLKIFGEAEGGMLIAFSEEQAMSLGNLLLGKDDTYQEMTEEKESALKETGNILASAYLSALSTFVGFNLIPSVPYFSHDLASAVVDSLITELGQTSDYALVIDTEFLFEKKAVAVKCFTFFGRDSFVSILKALGMHEK